MRYKGLLVFFIALAVFYPNALSASDRILHNFNATPNGSAPSGGLVQDASGDLYGTTSGGGAYGLGTVFKLTPNGTGGWNNSVLYSFRGGKDGNSPIGAMTFDTSGNLYGVTTFGGGLGVCNDLSGNNAFCGTVFELMRQGSGWIESVIYRFDAISGGYKLAGGLVFDTAGNLYSTTYSYSGGHGSVFQLVFSSGQWTENVLHTFTGGSDGDYPNTPVYLDQAGNIYGTAGIGGANQDGLVFELSRSGNSWTETVLYNFAGGSDGADPSTGLVSDSSGNLYGGTIGGGGSGCNGWGCGVVFKLMPGANGQWTESVIYSFTSSSKTHIDPLGLVFDIQGNLYGSTFYSDKCTECGSVFELTPTGNGPWIETTVWNFSAGADGQNPSLIIVDPAGQIFGTSSHTGDLGNGTVFELAKNAGGNWTETTIFDFAANIPDGQYPTTPLISDAAGELYCTAGGGPYGNGVVFELMPQNGGGWKQRILYGFPNDQEYVGPDGLAFDSQGNLFGVPGVGGSQGAARCLSCHRLPVVGGNTRSFRFPPRCRLPQRPCSGQCRSCLCKRRQSILWANSGAYPGFYRSMDGASHS